MVEHINKRNCLKRANTESCESATSSKEITGIIPTLNYQKTSIVIMATFFMLGLVALLLISGKEKKPYITIIYGN